MSDTIRENGMLPSEGKIYHREVNPHIEMRSMTTEEEMRRLSPSDTEFKRLADVLDACLVNPIGISSYDLHLGDFQYLMHKLRITTYGTDYPIVSKCPICGTRVPQTVDLSTLDVRVPDDSYEDLRHLSVTLLSGRVEELVLRPQTPRIVDNIRFDTDEFYKNNPDCNKNMEWFYTIKHGIVSINGQAATNSLKLESWLKKLPSKEAQAIFNRIIKLNGEVGVETLVDTKCTNPICGIPYRTSFRIDGKFWEPTIS